MDDALTRLRDLPTRTSDCRARPPSRLRTGFPEVVLGLGKTAEQIAVIAERLAARSERL